MANAKTIVVKLGSPEEAKLIEIGSEIVSVNRGAGEFTILIREGEAGWTSTRAFDAEVAE